MQHIYSRWVWPLIIGLPILAGRWELFLILLGTVITGQSLHESIHHQAGTFAKQYWRWLGISVAILGAYLLKTN